MLRFTCVAVGSLLLAGCGSSGDDFTVELYRSPERVMASLSSIDLAEARKALPELDIQTSQPGSNELVFTIPSKSFDGKEVDKSVVHLRFEPVRDGKATVIHAQVDVPATRVLMGKANMELSEVKVEAALKKLLERSGQSPAYGEAGGRTSKEMADLLVAVAVDSNIGMQGRINSIEHGDRSARDRMAMANDPEYGDDPRDKEATDGEPEDSGANNASGESREQP